MKLKIALKILAISIALAMVASGIVIGAGSINKASNVSLSSATIFVPDNYAKIQWAVDNASVGDTIIVRDGTYVENVDVTKSLTIISTSGNPEDTIVQAKNSNDNVFEVTADYVNISGFTLTGATGEDIAGLYLRYADYCNIKNNTALNNFWGIKLWNSSNNALANNTALNNYFGIGLSYSGNNNITNNNANLNNEDGISLWFSSNNVLKNNNANSNDEHGVYLGYLSNTTLKNNNVSNNNHLGIYLIYSSNNTLKSNIISNNWEGIGLYYSSNNLIYLNNFINNGDNVYYYNSTNIWNSTERITYTYNGETYESYLGNYWSDYVFEGNDTEGDGIGDSPHSINSDNDNYPLIEPFENYLIKENQPPIAKFTYALIYNPQGLVHGITFASNSYDLDGYIVSYEWDFGEGNNATGEIVAHSYASAGDYTVTLTVTDNDGATNSTTKTITYPPTAIFDTGSPANPYPSIFGTHNGTITPNQTITVSKLYTYPCVGTGGHTEYAEIGNKTWNATATWEGYAGDWHNISFDKTVVLLAGETYNYTIRTGSYPQIIHESSFNATGGEITCTKFTDANGKVYYDWIPAIRLWA